MRIVQSVALGAVVVLALGGAADRLVEETTVVLVEVPVQVSRDGQPVRGLTSGDFEVFEGRKKQEIVAFEVTDLATVGPAGEIAVSDVGIAARRHFLFLFDLSFSNPQNITQARHAALGLLDEGLHPADVVAVATYSESKGAQLVLGFTGNHEQVEYAIENLGLAKPGTPAGDPLGLLIADLSAAEASGGVSGGILRGDAVDVDAEFAENIRDLQGLTGRVGRDQQKNKVLALTESLLPIAQLMRDVEGRKHVVLLSEGFDSSILVGTENFERQQEIQRAVEQGETWRVDGEERYGDSVVQGGLESMIDEFRRADCAIQAVDIAGLDPATRASDVEGALQTSRNEGLFRMARGTGGELYRSYNRLADAMSDLLDKTSVTYLLAYQSSNVKLDDKFRRIKVKLKDAPRGTEVVHRPGYYPTKAFREQSELERQLFTAGLVLGGADGGQIDTAVLATSFAVPGERAYVPVIIEVGGPSLVAKAEGNQIVTDLFAYALDEDGAVRAFFTRRLGFDLAQAGPQLQQGGLKYWGHFDLPPGRYHVRTVVRDGSSGATGVATQELEVVEATTDQPSLLPPLVPDRTAWVLAREREDDQRAGVPYPFVLGEDSFIPAARPAWGGGDVQLCLAGYALDLGEAEVEAALVTADGTVVDRWSAQDVQPLAGVAPARWLAVFRPSARPQSGRYTLEVQVTAAFGEEVVTRLPFEVL